VDGHGRPYVAVKENERKESAAAFPLSALRHHRRFGVRLGAVVTDNARAFQPKRF